MRRLQPDQKNPTSLISYVPDSLKTRAQLDYITQVSNSLRSNREEYLKRLSNWELKDIEQAIWNYSREIENLRIHKEFSMVKIFKEEISIYKTAKQRMLKKVFLGKIKENKYFQWWAQVISPSSRLGSEPSP
ncbi:MAG: hypothetical protein Q8891_09040 [Bacteroidota bacterium]|nr:hypothetical protein [Bacteroidota bacterium]